MFWMVVSNILLPTRTFKAVISCVKKKKDECNLEISVPKEVMDKYSIEEARFC